MRIAIVLWAICFALFVGFCFADSGDQDIVLLTLSTASTNASPIAGDQMTNSTPRYGWIDSIILNIGGDTSPTCTVQIATAGDTGSGASRTLYLKTGFTTDSVVYPREIAQTADGTTITNKGVKMFLLQDKLVLRAYASNQTNAITLSAHVVISGTP